MLSDTKKGAVGQRVAVLDRCLFSFLWRVLVAVNKDLLFFGTVSLGTVADYKLVLLIVLDPCLPGPPGGRSHPLERHLPIWRTACRRRFQKTKN